MKTCMSTFKMIYFVVLICLCLVLVIDITPAYAIVTILYTKPSATGAGNCSSWDNACTLAYALGSVAASGNEIWVQSGTHTPGAARTDTLQLITGVAVYGGFSGTETERSQRDPDTNITILSGDINGDDTQNPITDLTTVSNNENNSYHVVTGSGTDATAILDGFTITGGYADGFDSPENRGAGFYNSGGSPNLNDITFSGNSATHGGGIFNYNNSSPTLTNVAFSNNSATMGGSGGGMYNYSNSSPTLIGITLNDNSADYGGGGMINNDSSSPTMTDVTFSDNSAAEGGGMENINSNPSLNHVTFNSNTADSSGGGMYNDSSTPTLTDVTFHNNSSDEGGGMYNYLCSPILNNITFSSNTATSFGGGIYNSTDSNPVLTNATFSGNSASDLGGGIFNNFNSPTLNYATFNGNSANYGGGIFIDGGNLSLNSVILWGDTAGSDGVEILISSSTITITDSVVDGGCPSGANCTNIIDTNPILGPLANNGGYTQTIALGTGSPAINMGNNGACPSTDQRGIPRPQGIGCDIGSYEFALELIPPLNGAAEITSNQPIVSIARPHLGIEIAAYNGVTDGALVNYLPMLFNDIWGGFTATFTVQNVTNSQATFTITFQDAAATKNATQCILSNQVLEPHGVRTYDVADLGTCDGGVTHPIKWVGSAMIESDHALAVMATPYIYGTNAVTYTAFSGGAPTAYLPMLFRGIWGFDAAFYVQNLDPSDNANISIEFYDNEGNYTCTYDDPVDLAPADTRGYWMPNVVCDGGAEFPTKLVDGEEVNWWAGSAVIKTQVGEAPSTNIVALARPHIWGEIAVYNGYSSGATQNYLPMLFREKWGFNAAIYVQNITDQPVDEISITFFDVDGNETCLYTDSADLSPYATRGYWMPQVSCNDGRNFPATGGWYGSAVIETNVDVVVVARPHLWDDQVVAYNAFTSGTTGVFVPYLFRSYNGNDSALYIQNLGASPANTTINFYDEDSGFYCTMDKVVQPGASAAIWLAQMDNAVCVP